MIMFTHLGNSILLLSIALSYALPSKVLQFSSYRIDLTTTAETEARSLSTDDYGNTYIVGNTYGNFGDADVNHLSDMSIFIAKFSKTGILVWLRRTGSAQADRALSIFYFGAVLYVTGLTKGNISTDSSPQDTSYGIHDGFVLAYSSFTGKRKWSTQLGRSGVLSQVDVVTASHRGGVLIAGHSNLPLREKGSSAHGMAATGRRFFVASLSHVTGDMRLFAQHELNSASQSMLLPAQIMLTGDSGVVFLIVQVTENSGIKDSVVVSLLPSNLSKLMVQSLSAQRLRKVSKGLTEDLKTGNIVISYSINVADASTRDFGLQIVHRNGSSMSMDKTKMMDLNSNSDDMCYGMELIGMRHAVMLGSVTKGDGNETTEQLGVWIYDVRNGETVGTYLSSRAESMSSMRVTGFCKDSEEDIVFAGVREKKSGAREVMLGTFGIPPHLKSNSGAHLTTNKPSDLNSNVNYSYAVNATAIAGLFTLDENGRLRTDGVVAICLCAVLGILLVAVVSLCMVKIWRARDIHE